MTILRKILPLFLLAIGITACQKAPDMYELSGDLMVYTHYDNQCDYSQYKTFYLPDSLLVLNSERLKPVYYTSNDNRARQIIEAVESEMTMRGYTQVYDRADADLGITLTYMKNTSEYVTFIDPYWWWIDYYWPIGYWDPFYNGWYPYYPYPVTYSYTVNSLITEIAALKDANSEKKQMPYIWTSIMAGIEDNNQINVSKAVSGIYQAFEQSPYINSNAQ